MTVSATTGDRAAALKAAVDRDGDGHDAVLLLALADVLQERNDPCVPGLRVVGALTPRLRPDRTGDVAWHWWRFVPGRDPYPACLCSLPHDWFDLLPGGRRVDYYKDTDPEIAEWYYGVVQYSVPTRWEAVEAAALAFSLLTPARRDECATGYWL